MNHNKWNHAEIKNLFELPLIELVFTAHSIHRQHFSPQEIELCTLLNIKTGACPEDCAYCSQSGHYQTEIKRERLLSIDDVVLKAQQAKQNGATRFCMGAAWRNPPKKDLPKVVEMIKAVKDIGLETCVTLGMLNEEQATILKEAGLDFYNHNLDTSPEYYQKIITTHTHEDRLNTLEEVRKVNIQVCSGCIIGMGETREDRIELLYQFAKLPTPPQSIPINRLIPMAGTPLHHVESIDHFEFIKTIAITRIMMPTSIIRLSAGRSTMSDEFQTLCFMAGANSMWLGDKLLTAKNPDYHADVLLLNRLGMQGKTLNTQTDEYVN